MVRSLLPATAMLLATTAMAQFDMFRESLPPDAGEIALQDLQQPVHITRDRLGVPSITGESLHDVIRAEGFVHAQDRFFQMDTTRRLAAGRLAEVAGPALLPTDQHYRGYRFEHVAEEILDQLPAATRALLRVYAEGVNAGLANLKGPPPEYAILRVEPEPWKPADCILVMLAMFDSLHFNANFERMIAVMDDALPAEVVSFLTSTTTRFDVPLLPSDAPDNPHPNGYRPMAIPSADVYDLRGDATSLHHEDLIEVTPIAAGSNNWAVAGSRSTHGGAILANDPHLHLTAPVIWYRAHLAWNDHFAVGASLPGSPGIIIGSNGSIAWGFTNAMADFQDLVLIEVDADDPDRYRAADGYEPFELIREEIHVRGAEPVELILRKTRWGIVVDEDHHGRPRVLKWTALEPEMVNLRVLDLMTAKTVDEAINIARQWRGPAQNVLIADRTGRIGWTVSGYFPQRAGFDGTRPTIWREPEVGWNGPLPEDLRPALVDPRGGILYTANNRTVDPDWAKRLGNTWATGLRARRIRELLQSREQFDEEQLFAMQLDTRVIALELYRELVLELTVDAEPESPLAQVRAIVEEWNGRAEVDEPAMRIVDAYRTALHRAVLASIVEPCRNITPAFRYVWFQSEEPFRRILEERPEHLLPARFESWDDLLLRTLELTISMLSVEDPQGLEATWGEVNRAAITHPLAEAAPLFSTLLNMPDDPLPGHFSAVRVAMPAFGASLRLVVSPGRESEGIMHIPTGQSGHPLSPHYRDSHRAWVQGLPTPLMLAPEDGRSLTLVPGL